MKNQTISIVLLGFLFIPTCTQAKEEIDKYQAKVWQSPQGGTLLYRFRAPEKIERTKKYPLLFFLHGSGGRGNDNKGQIQDGGVIGAFAKQGVFSKHGSYVLAAQVSEGERWVDVDWTTLEHKMPQISNHMRMAFEALDAFVTDKKNQIDLDRIYVMGLSMGGYGTWDAIQRRPEFFAAAVPICGGGDTNMGKVLAKMPIWSWHGDKDKTIQVSRSREMDAAIKQAGGSPKYTEVKGRGHNVWTDVWNSKELWDWLYSQSR